MRDMLPIGLQAGRQAFGLDVGEDFFHLFAVSQAGPDPTIEILCFTHLCIGHRVGGQ